jgi:hypothetical protein
VPRTIGRRSGTRRPLRRQSEREDSLSPEFGFGATAHVVPRDACGLACQSTAGSPFDFSGPGSLHLFWVFRRRIVKACQQLGGNISPFFEGQRQGFAQDILRSGRHPAILHGTHSNKTLHPTALARSRRA